LTGLISSGLISYRNREFKLLAPKEYCIEYTFTLLSDHSYWSQEKYNLVGKMVEFVVSFKGRGTIIVGIGTQNCLANEENKLNDGEEILSIGLNRGRFQIRKNGNNMKGSGAKLLPAQEKAKIRIKVGGEGKVVVNFEPSSSTDAVETQEVVGMLMSKPFHLFMRAPPGVHDVKYHDVDIKEAEDKDVWFKEAEDEDNLCFQLFGNILQFDSGNLKSSDAC